MKQPEHKSMEELKCIWVKKGDYENAIDKLHWIMSDPLAYEIETFEPHLNSRNLVERLRMHKRETFRLLPRGLDKNVIEKMDIVRTSKDEGYNEAVDEINKKLDEFLESELNERKPE